MYLPVGSHSTSVTPGCSAEFMEVMSAVSMNSRAPPILHVITCTCTCIRTVYIATKDLQPTAPQLSRLGTLCPTLIYCICVCLFVCFIGWEFLGFLSPPIYSFASMLHTYMYISMYLNSGAALYGLQAVCNFKPHNLSILIPWRMCIVLAGAITHGRCVCVCVCCLTPSCQPTRQTVQ